MLRTKSDDIVIRYAALEPGLALMLGAGAGGVGALRGRLKRLSSLGIPGNGPGKGTRRNYSWEDAVQLAIALLLEDCSLDPVAVAAALKNAWPRLVRSAMAAVEAPADNPMMLTARLETVAGPWKAVEATWISIVPRTDQPSRGRWIATYRKDFAKISRKTKPAVGKPIEEFIEKLIEELATHKADNAVLRLEQESPGWLAIRKNLTEHLRVLQTALKDTPRGRS